MSWLLRHNWLWSLIAFLIGAAITWILLERRQPAPEPQVEEPAEEKQEVLVGAAMAKSPPAARSESPAIARAESPPVTRAEPQPVVRTEPTPTRVEPKPVRAEPTPVREEPTPARVGPRRVQEAPAPVVREQSAPVFSRLMEAEPTLFDHLDPVGGDDTGATEPQVRADAPPGRYGEGSADAVPHQGPPDGFTIKGNAQSMLFHTPDSPYYGRTKPEVWFRSESDAERAGFTRYTRRPRKSANPHD
ncbi:sunset domain-containing protein [Kribbella sp. NBC_00359]|uniref:sunset domain-containing protein n=1 Tax=Kribbella sp. NBC_00359 TaxID=2975966 RepID=UPI002E1E6550